MSVADPGFSRGRQLQSWAWKSYYLVNFLEIGPREGARVPGATPDPPIHVAAVCFWCWDVVGSSCQNETKPDTIPRLLGAQIVKVANQKKKSKTLKRPWRVNTKRTLTWSALHLISIWYHSLPPGAPLYTQCFISSTTWNFFLKRSDKSSHYWKESIFSQSTPQLIGY